MIRKEDLLNIAKFKGLVPKLAELDYFQDIALLNISKEFGNKLIFKGGTCLYKVYNLNRFSEDLDFTAKKQFKPKNFFNRLPFFFDLLGIKSRANVEKFHNSVNVYLELIGPLSDSRKETTTRMMFNISLKERVLLQPKLFSYLSLYQEVKPFDLFVMDEREILAEKARAIYLRDKARDVYDFWYLLNKKNIAFDLDLVNKKLSHHDLKFNKYKFMANIDEKKVSWEKDLSALISGVLPKFNNVKKEIEKNLP